jgi:tRNA (guanine-N(7)-)-methyltransferase subunit TRM82
MPKRPCAIALTDDDTTIIVADKFGDVYSLPVLATELEPYAVSHCTTAQIPEPLAPKAFDPAANELTVHSQRNRKALENQRRQNSKPSEKSEPIFEHKLLLGHVSMLTDIALATSEGRNYIITADRDEHIRISRGIPQTHIIEGFCLGHTEFVSRLCVPTGRSSLLISGGGDDFLFVWNWSSGLLLSKIDLKPLVRVVLSELNPKNRADGSVDLLKVAVSGILHAKLIGSGGTDDVVIVFCEG